jgi:hypothetical protein
MFSQPCCSLWMVVTVSIAVIITLLLTCGLSIYVCYKKRSVVINLFLRLTRRTQTPQRVNIRDHIEMVDMMGGANRPQKPKPPNRPASKRPNRPPPPPPPVSKGARPKTPLSEQNKLNDDIEGATGGQEVNHLSDMKSASRSSDFSLQIDVIGEGHLEGVPLAITTSHTDQLQPRTPSPIFTPGGTTYSRQDQSSRPHPPYLPIRATRIPALPQFSPFTPPNYADIGSMTTSSYSDPQQIDQTDLDFSDNIVIDSDSSIFDTPSIVYRESDFWDEEGNPVDPDNPASSINIDTDIQHVPDNRHNDLDLAAPNNDQEISLNLTPQNIDHSAENDDQSNVNNWFVNNPFNPINNDLDLTPSRENRNISLSTPNNNDLPTNNNELPTNNNNDLATNDLPTNNNDLPTNSVQERVIDDTNAEDDQGPPANCTRSHVKK